MDINILDFKILGDDRGSLISIEQSKNIPIDIKRVYYIFGTKNNIRRGFHAHKKLKQVAVCISGSCKFLLDNGETKKTTLLNSPDKGLLINDMIWHEMYNFSSDCVLMVLADDFYDENDYIRNYDEFLKVVNG